MLLLSGLLQANSIVLSQKVIGYYFCISGSHSMLFLYVHIFNLTLYLLCYFLFKADMIIMSSQSKLDGNA